MDLNGAMSLSAGTALSSYGCMHETEGKKTQHVRQTYVEVPTASIAISTI